MADLDQLYELRYAEGLAFMRQFRDSVSFDERIDELNSHSATFAAYSVGSTYGDVYRRDGMHIRDRELVTIAILAAVGGCEDQLGVHIEIGINAGITPEEIVETMVQVAAYAGAPRGSNGMRTAGPVLASIGVVRPDLSGQVDSPEAGG